MGSCHLQLLIAQGQATDHGNTLHEGHQSWFNTATTFLLVIMLSSQHDHLDRINTIRKSTMLGAEKTYLCEWALKINT